MTDPVSIALGVGGVVATELADSARQKLEQRAWRKRLVKRTRSLSGERFSKKKLARWLGDRSNWGLLVEGSADQLAKALAGVLWPTDHRSQGSGSKALRVAEALLSELIASLPASQATSVAHERQMKAIAGLSSFASGLPELLSKFPPSCREPLRSLQHLDEPMAIKLVGALGTDRASWRVASSTLIAVPPAWLREAPFQAHLVVAGIAEALTDHQSASLAYERAADAGAQPRSCWLTWAALNAHDVHDVSRSTELLKRAGAGDPHHPLPTAAASLLDGDSAKAIELLHSTSTETPAEEILRAVLQRGAYIDLDDTTSAIAAFEGLLVKFPERGGVAFTLAELYTTRSRERNDRGKEDDLQRAAELALRSRDQLREWSGGSERATILAAKLAMNDGDAGEVLRLTRPPPDGEATDEEAATPEVMGLAAAAANVIGRADLATRLAAGLSEADGTLLRAMDARRAGDTVAAVAEYESLLASADEPNIQMAAYHGLAVLGVWPLEGLDALAEQNPTPVEIVRAASEAARGLKEPAKARLRRVLDDGPYVAEALASLEMEDGNVDAALNLLDQAASRFGATSIEVIAVDIAADCGRLDDSAARAKRALTNGKLRPSAIRHLRRRIIDAAISRLDWVEAEVQARELLRAHDTDEEVRWALAVTLYNQGRIADAWAEMKRVPALTPQSEQRAALWVQLATKFEPNASTVSTVVELAQCYSASEEFVARALGSVYTMGSDFELPPETLSALHASTDAFLEHFPESVHFRAVSAENPERLVEQLGASLSVGAQSRRVAAENVAKGEVPYGLLAAVLDRPYAAVLTGRAAGCFPVWLPTDGPSAEFEIASTAIESRSIVVDLSALNLALLISGLYDEVRGVFDDFLVAQPSVLDAVAGAADLATKSTTSIGWDDRAGQLQLHEMTEAEVDLLARRAQELAEAVLRMRAEPVTELTTFPDLEMERFGAWLAPLELAARAGRPLYCDDRVLRSLAASVGVQSFGSVALLRVLHARGQLSSDALNNFERKMREEYCVDFELDPQLFLEMGEDSKWSSGPVLMTILRPAFWANPQLAVTLLREVRTRVVATDPALLASWTYATVRGALASLPSERRRDTASVLLYSAIAASMSDSDAVAAQVVAARQACDEMTVADPLPIAAALSYQALEPDLGPELAANQVLRLFRGLGLEDRALVLQSLFHPSADVITAPSE